MTLNAQGLDITTDSLESIHVIDQLVEQLLGYGKDMEAIIQGVKANPGRVLTNAQAAALQLLIETDDKIWERTAKDSAQCHLDAIALLLRLELQGVDVGERWRWIGNYVVNYVPDQVISLSDVQFIYALGRSGHEAKAQEMFQSIQAYVETASLAQDPDIQFIWTNVTLPIAGGMLAHAVKDWSAAVVDLGAAIPHLHKIGGSYAQRDLFEQVYIDALIQSGEYRSARNRIEQWARGRNHIPLIYQAKIYDSILASSGALGC